MACTCTAVNASMKERKQRKLYAGRRELWEALDRPMASWPIKGVELGGCIHAQGVMSSREGGRLEFTACPPLGDTVCNVQMMLIFALSGGSSSEIASQLGVKYGQQRGPHCIVNSTHKTRLDPRSLMTRDGTRRQWPRDSLCWPADVALLSSLRHSS